MRKKKIFILTILKMAWTGYTKIRKYIYENRGKYAEDKFLPKKSLKTWGCYVIIYLKVSRPVTLILLNNPIR